MLLDFLVVLFYFYNRSFMGTDCSSMSFYRIERLRCIVRLIILFFRVIKFSLFVF